MPESIPEIPKRFIEFINQGQEFTPEGAIAKLAEFHGTGTEAVKSVFLNLERAEEGVKVKFREGIANGVPCIVMEGFLEGKWRWNSLIDENSGQPIARTG